VKFYRPEENDQTEVQIPALFIPPPVEGGCVLHRWKRWVGSGVTRNPQGNCDERSGDKSERIGKC